jgi:cyanophycin synthetase
VLVAYAHTPAAFDGLMQLVSHFPARRRIGVLAIPGDRRDEDIRRAGKSAAEGGYLDLAIVKEDQDLRGREPGEVAELIGDGLRAAGLPDEKIVVILNEADAVAKAMDVAGEDDLVFILADKVPKTLALVREQVVDEPGDSVGGTP